MKPTMVQRIRDGLNGVLAFSGCGKTISNDFDCMIPLQKIRWIENKFGIKLTWWALFSD
jgi:hypothetical protein